jgi:hypothetical protein
MKGRRRAHIRSYKTGRKTQVREHNFSNSGVRSEFTLSWRNGEARINGSVSYQTRCPQCKSPVFFYRNDAGSRVFFDALGKPWPVHGCMHKVRRLQTLSIEDAVPVTKANRFDRQNSPAEAAELIVDLKQLNKAVKAFNRARVRSAKLSKPSLGREKS